MGFLLDLLEALVESGSGGTRPRGLVTMTKPAVPPGRTLVERRARSIWELRGWQHEGNDYRGYYRNRYGAYPGRIVCRPGKQPQLFISHPPAALWQHSHRHCFFKRGPNEYEIHFSTPGQSIDDSILAVEKILREAVERQ